MKQLTVREQTIPGLFEIGLEVHGDERGWLKENYQQEKLEAEGLPHFTIVQNTISFNREPGVTRGFHAEPWQKFISVATGSVLGAYLDLRTGSTFGRVVTIAITSETAVFVPAGVANAYQVTEPNTAYTYLQSGVWQPDGQYVSVNAFDPALAVSWPVPREQAIVSAKDQANSLLADIHSLDW